MPFKVKHYLIHAICAVLDNRQMADLDGTELARRLRRAMDNKSPKLTSAALAAACSVSAQAVNGWRKNGRIAKKHLPEIASRTGKPLEYFLAEDPDSVKVSGMSLTADEVEAMKTLQAALPDWRRYVLKLAMIPSRDTQKIMLAVFSKAAPDEAVAAAYGKPRKKKLLQRN